MTTGFKVVPPETILAVGDQLNVAFGEYVEPPAFIETVVVVQFNGGGATMFGTGGALSWSMVTETTAVHEFEVFVTVSV